MAINPDNIDTVTVPELDTVVLALENFFAHSAPNGTLGKATISNLATFLSPYVASVGASGYIEVATNSLPTPVITNGFSFVGSGTYTKSGQPDVNVTGDINILSWNGTTWALTKEISIDLSNYTTFTDVDSKISDNNKIIYGALTEQRPVINISDMPSIGGGGNRVFNNYKSDFARSYSQVYVNVASSQTIKVLKLAVNGTTITELQTFSAIAGDNTFILTTPVNFIANEKIGIWFLGDPRFTGDPDANSPGGSRYFDGTNWATIGFTWGYSAFFDGDVSNLTYPNFRTVNERLEDIENYEERPVTGIEKFQVTVNGNYPYYDNETTAVSDTTSAHVDDAVIALPAGYLKNGNPTRMVIYCHGAGSPVNSSTNNLGTNTVAYLLAKGYAVLDVNGLPADIWESGEPDSKCAGMGGQIALQCYTKAYRYVINKYNLAKDGVLIFGQSMGGLTSCNLIAQNAIPILAQVLEAPITDLYTQAWLNPFFGGAKGTRFETAKYYNFTNYNTFDFAGATSGQLQTYWDANRSKVVGFNPSEFQSITPVTSVNFGSGTASYSKFKNHRVPLLIIHSIYDTVSTIINSVNFVNSIKFAGGIASLRKVDDGNVNPNQHSPMDFTDVITDAEGVTTRATVREAYLFFKRYTL